MKVPGFLNENQRAIFEKMLGNLRSAVGSDPPGVRKCENRNELALWFTQFGVACRAALPEKVAAS